MNVIPNLNKLIYQLVCYQRALITTFTTTYPDLKDWSFLLDFPKSGQIEIDNQIWLFKKHGAGLLFSNTSTYEVVDVHKYIDNPEIFDSWRLEQFLDSIGIDSTKYNLDRCLADLQNQGLIESSKIQNGYFEIVPFTNG